MTRAAFEKIAGGLRDALPIERKYEWEAERRYLNHRVQEAQRRIAELDEILSLFWPEKANG